MMNIILAGALIALSYGVENSKTGTGARCNNYFLGYYWSTYSSSYLYPVGFCYQENSDPDIYSSFGNYKFMCELDTAERFSNITGAKMVVKYSTGANCAGSAVAVTEDTDYDGDGHYETVAYPCNGKEDQCECVVGGATTAETSECQLFEETNYDMDWGLSGFYCNHKEWTVTRYVVNMCIQPGDNGLGSSTGTYKFACGGDSERTGKTDALYEYNFGNYEGYMLETCSSSATGAPTEATTGTPTMSGPQPTSAPTADTSGIYCSESTCDTNISPLADGVNTYSVIFAMIFVGLNVAIFA